jgi:hypothetical protein
VLCLWLVAYLRGVLSHSAGAARAGVGESGPRPPGSSPSASALVLRQFGTKIMPSEAGPFGNPSKSAQGRLVSRIRTSVRSNPRSCRPRAFLSLLLYCDQPPPYVGNCTTGTRARWRQRTRSSGFLAGSARKERNTQRRGPGTPQDFRSRASHAATAHEHART